MGMQMEGATGNGFGAKVNSENQLATAATMVTKEHEINHADGQAYSAIYNTTPDAGKCFAYIKNLSDNDMIVAEIAFTNKDASTATGFSIFLGDEGTPIGGTAITPGNRNAGSGNSASVTALIAADITGLSGGVQVGGIYVTGGSNTVRISPASGFIIPKNKVLTVYSSASVAVSVGLGLTFHTIEN